MNREVYKSNKVVGLAYAAGYYELKNLDVIEH